jgi:hypothetical protein
MVPPESAQTSAAKYTALAGEASAEAAMKRVTAAEVGASRDGGKAAAEMSAAEAASEMTTAEATTKMAAAGMAATETAPKMAAPAETTMAAATAAPRQCGGRKRGATDGNGHCKNKDGFTQHDKLLRGRGVLLIASATMRAMSELAPRQIAVCRRLRRLGADCGLRRHSRHFECAT